MLDRSRVGTLMVLALSLALPACGRKTPIRPPELAAPERISNLTASNIAEGIQLSWQRPTKYADGTRMTDLGGFRVDRSAPGVPFATVATVPVTDQERFRQERRFRWVDPDTQVGSIYQYRVASFTTDGYVSEPSDIITVERSIPTPAATRSPTPAATGIPTRGR